MKPKIVKELIAREQREVYLLVLKRKKTGQVNGRGCADGRKQWAYTGKDEATATEARFLTAVLDAMEGRCVAVMDVPGAFRKTKRCMSD